LYKNIPGAFLLPKIVRVKSNLYIACFDLIKLIPAQYILEKAAAEKKISKGSIIIESSSGTFGLALAIYCCLKEYKLIIVSDPIIDESFRRRLEDLGAQVEIVNAKANNGNIQKTRMERMALIKEQYPQHFHPGQYDKPENVESYSILSEYLTKELGNIDFLVGTVGTGGSMCGTSNYLRSNNSSLKAIGVDTFNSVLFGMEDGPRVLRGLGNCLKVANVDHTVFDAVHWVSAELAFHKTRLLHQRFTAFQGPTSGAAFHVADWYSEKNPDAKIVCLCPDSGHRYLNTVYNDIWLKQNNLIQVKFPSEPLQVCRPADALPPWTSINWERKTYMEIVGQPYV
jgi:cysteine synthase A